MSETTLSLVISTTQRDTIDKVKNTINNTMLKNFDMNLTWDIQEVTK